MKLLFFNPLNLSYGRGVEKWMIRISRRLVQKYDVHITVCDTLLGENRLSTQYITKSFANHICYVTLPTINCESIAFFKPKALNLLMTLAHKCDAVYYNGGFASFDPFFYYLDKKIPAICGWRAPIFFNNFAHNAYVLTLKKQFAKAYSGHHVLNLHYKTLLEKWKCKNVFQIRSGVDSKRYLPDIYKWEADTFRILFAGALEYQKGFDILVLSLKKFLSIYRGNNFEVTILGEGSLKDKLDIFKGDPRLKYYGYVEDIIPYLSRSHLVLVPSRYEPFGHIVLEAMACENLVIASKTLGPLSIITNGYDGIILNDISYETILTEMVRVYNLFLNDREKFKNIAIRARRTIIEKFSMNAEIKSLINMFKTIIEFRSH